jgi:hypothetical protein
MLAAAQWLPRGLLRTSGLSELNESLRRLTRRYGDVDSLKLEAVMAPALLPIVEIDSTLVKATKSLWTARFQVQVEEDAAPFIVAGRTGKFVPAAYHEGEAPWREIAKGRFITDLPEGGEIGEGEVYYGTGGSRSALEEALAELKVGDYLEIDRFGASAKLTSALVEASLLQLAEEAGFTVRRMPEDVAKHISETYPSYDFEIADSGVTAKVEVKSVWGTDTTKARLIRTKTKTNPTSSCRFDTQHLFAVSLFLRTGSLMDFAFALSVSRDHDPEWGLATATDEHGNPIPTHVHQNPPISSPPDRPWMPDLRQAFELAVERGIVASG